MTTPARPRQWGSTLPQRDKPMTRTPLTVVRDIGSGTARTPIKKVSARRARENRARAAMADRLWPDRREGTVMCSCGCGYPADDLHEPLSRARGGGITDEENAVPMRRACHDKVTFTPESELGWAYKAGLLRHSFSDVDPEGPGAA